MQQLHREYSGYHRGNDVILQVKDINHDVLDVLSAVYNFALINNVSA